MAVRTRGPRITSPRAFAAGLVLALGAAGLPAQDRAPSQAPALATAPAGADSAPSLAAPVAAAADLSEPEPRARRTVLAARAQIGVTVRYDPAYVRLDFPGGDVPADRGVCTDVVIRALRAVGLDLQQAVNADMRGHFSAYPHTWGLAGPDRNIDHRRVPNLETFFERAGYALPPGSAWRPGDIVSWRLTNGLPHIGIVADSRSADGGWAIVHNIGGGARLEAASPAWPPVGHYRLPATADGS